ncbi:ABC transporter substrate-binding protein [Pseudactinotalea sp. Z1739]|uniref:ABC transporter substrate-binding protein n=1 Tax=Pseudactinotalea sp. Z1739 TaxID=3413028 RepID=UPI003C79AA81
MRPTSPGAALPPTRCAGAAPPPTRSGRGLLRLLFLPLAALLLMLGACSSGVPADEPDGAAENATGQSGGEQSGETGTADDDASAQDEGTQEQGFPRTVDVPAGDDRPATEVTIPAEPQRVTALTYETAALVAELGAGEKLVMAPAEAANPVLSNQPDVMADVEHHIASESAVDAEAVIASDPDLVVFNDRHGMEEGVGRVLTEAGIPVLVLPNTFSSVSEMLTNIDLVGTALGMEQEAADLATTLSDGLVDASDEDGPSVLVLSNQAGRPFVTAGGAFPLEVVRLAGGRDASADLGMVRSGPISAEQVLAADPDRILLVDMNGSGETIFADLLNNPAVAALPAVAEHEPFLVEGKYVQALGFTSTVEGRDQIATWLDQ